MTRCWWLILFSCLSVLTTLTHAESLSFEGRAFDPENDALLYTEAHQIQRESDGRYVQSDVEYRGDDGELWAQKTLQFGTNPLLPEVSFSDSRYEVKLSLTTQSESLTIEQSQGDALQQNTLSFGADDRVVADAGFDRLVQQSWSQIVSGEQVNFEFVALTRAKLVSFRIRKTGLADGMVTMVVEPQNWFFRMLVDPITLQYDEAKRRLRQFEGLTNIPHTSPDDYYTARIEYRYADEASE